MSAATRFAPSPTGLLHVGNARVALVNWLYARKAGGRFVLRIDDTDAERSEARLAAAIERDLAWLGLDWDAVVHQSARLSRYRAAFDRLAAAGRAYPCYETAEALALARKRRLTRGEPPVYDRAALALDADALARLEAEGRRPHWRFRLPDEAVAWTDLVHGAMRIEPRTMSDPVVMRADGRPTYTLASAVDDLDLGISHVIRGDDHIANTAVQIALMAALGAARPPAFAHLPLIVDVSGRNLSKRAGSLSLASLREAGIKPLAVVSLLARLGTSDPVVPLASLDEALAGFDLTRFGRASPRFDMAELARLNARILHRLPFAAVADRLAALGVRDADEAFWNAVRENLGRLAKASEWWEVVRGPIAPAIEDSDFARSAAEHLPPEPWDATTWRRWTEAVAAATGRRGRALYHPLRLALTGRERGPEMRYLLPLIGRERACARLCGRQA